MKNKFWAAQFGAAMMIGTQLILAGHWYWALWPLVLGIGFLTLVEG